MPSARASIQWWSDWVHRKRIWTAALLAVLLPIGLLVVAAPAGAVAAPMVTKVTPTSGRTAAGTVVTVTGRNFTRVTAVRFGTTAATAISVRSSTSLTVHAPAHPAGTVDVRVSTAYGTSPASTGDRYVFVAPPVVSAVSPTSGKTAAGTRVTVTGRNFSHVTGVKFGTAAGNAISVASSTRLTVTAPAHSAGTVDIRVSTSYGTSAAVTADHYVFVAPPVISSISPTVGKSAGGTRVTITGTGFSRLTSVTFGGAAGMSLSVLASTKLQVTAPAHTAGRVDVRVIGQYGTSAIATADGYTYLAPPTAVTNLTATPGTNGAMVLTWSNPAGSNYNGTLIVYQQGTVAPPSPTAGQGSEQTDRLAHTATFALTPGTTYSFAVYSRDSLGGYGGRSTITAATGAAAVTWTTPVDPDTGGIRAVSCPTVSICLAADQDGNVVRWDGTAWSDPVYVGVFVEWNGQGLSCVSATWCVIVGSATYATYDGTGWSNARTVPSALSRFPASLPRSASVSAWTACRDSTAPHGRRRPQPGSVTALDSPTCRMFLANDVHFITRLNRQYTIFNGATFTAAQSLTAQVTALACGGTLCVAGDELGQVLTSTGGSLTPTATTGEQATGISCTSATFCMIVAAGIYRFDGTTTTLTSNEVSEQYVACGSPTTCWSVDGNDGGRRWDGHTWSETTLIDPFSGDAAHVDCPTAQFCLSIDGTGNAVTYNGSTWSKPRYLGLPNSALSCSSATSCMAVGTRYDPLTDVQTAVAARIDGATWSATSDISTALYFDKVSCPADGFCVATANDGDVAVFDNNTWTTASVDSGHSLQSVSCASRNFCLVGDDAGNVLIYSGSTWSAPQTIDAGQWISTMSCVSVSFCLAGDTAGRVVQYTGSAWTNPTPIAAGVGYLSTLSCVSTTFCMAGQARAATGAPLVYQFDGSTWQPVQDAVTTGKGTDFMVPYLTTVTCSTTELCAVGFEDNTS